MVTVKDMSERKTFTKNTLRLQAEALLRVLSTLTLLEEYIVRWRLGFMEKQKRKGLVRVEDLARHFKLSTEDVLRAERRAIRKLRASKRSAILREAGIDTRILFPRSTGHTAERQRLQSLQRVVACVKALSPELIAHLRTHHDDMSLIPPEVFEHLVGELFASWGWDEVRLVGRNSETSADILAGRFDNNLGERTRYFIEVKKWKHRIGIEVINQVLGAMIDERPKFGWHAAMIVTVAGGKNTRKYSLEELRLKGVWIKDQSDLNRWLDGYKPAPSGLWIPSSTFCQGNVLLSSADDSKQDLDKTVLKVKKEEVAQTVDYPMQIRHSKSSNQITVQEGKSEVAKGSNCTVEITFKANDDPYEIRSQSIHLKANARRRIDRAIGLQTVLYKIKPYLKGLPMPSHPEGSEAIIIYLPERHDEFEKIMSELCLDTRLLSKLRTEPIADDVREAPIEVAKRILLKLTRGQASTRKGKQDKP